MYAALPSLRSENSSFSCNFNGGSLCGYTSTVDQVDASWGPVPADDSTDSPHAGNLVQHMTSVEIRKILTGPKYMPTPPYNLLRVTPN